ncbi:MAG: DUF1080 domain-containing protein [Bacteroidetes bacterium]|nr:MAG: DUF1080 domain-containing protein [Bacteroidota bacterium]
MRFYPLILVSLLACSTPPQQAETTVTPEPEAITPPTYSPLNALTPEEEAEGWSLLFDGESGQGWHTFGKDSLTGWEIADGELRTPGNKGDIVTDETFADFELYIEWKISEGGNSGIMFHVQEGADYTYTFETGPEFQIIDDEGYESPLDNTQKTGANYALQAPTVAAAMPVGTYNTTRIRVWKGKVQHFLNGQMVVTYKQDSPEWEAIKNKTKFKDMPGYAAFSSGHIALQDHGDAVAFRSIKIRPL